MIFRLKIWTMHHVEFIYAVDSVIMATHFFGVASTLIHFFAIFHHLKEMEKSDSQFVPEKGLWAHEWANVWLYADTARFFCCQFGQAWFMNLRMSSDDIYSKWKVWMAWKSYKHFTIEYLQKRSINISISRNFAVWHVCFICIYICEMGVKAHWIFRPRSFFIWHK